MYNLELKIPKEDLFSTIKEMKIGDIAILQEPVTYLGSYIIKTILGTISFHSAYVSWDNDNTNKIKLLPRGAKIILEQS